MEAEYVITDSYHGLLFSLLFHKPYRLVINHSRGASRFDSVAHLLDFHVNEPIDWDEFDGHLETMRKKSILFLENAL